MAWRMAASEHAELLRLQLEHNSSGGTCIVGRRDPDLLCQCADQWHRVGKRDVRLEGGRLMLELQSLNAADAHRDQIGRLRVRLPCANANKMGLSVLSEMQEITASPKFPY